MAPQIIYIAISAVGLGLALHQRSNSNEMDRFWSMFVGEAIVWSLLWWGGFFVPLTGV